MVLGFEIAVLGAHRRVGHFGQHRVDVEVGRGVLPLFRLPALSRLPGHWPAQEAKCLAVGNRLMSVPVSANSALAPRSPTPATASSFSTAAQNEEGAAAPTRSLTFSIFFSRKSYCSSN